MQLFRFVHIAVALHAARLLFRLGLATAVSRAARVVNHQVVLGARLIEILCRNRVTHARLTHRKFHAKFSALRGSWVAATLAICAIIAVRNDVHSPFRTVHECLYPRLLLFEAVHALARADGVRSAHVNWPFVERKWAVVAECANRLIAVGSGSKVAGRWSVVTGMQEVVQVSLSDVVRNAACVQRQWTVLEVHMGKHVGNHVQASQKTTRGRIHRGHQQFLEGCLGHTARSLQNDPRHLRRQSTLELKNADYLD